MADADKVINDHAGSVRTHSGAQGQDFGATYELLKPFMGLNQISLIAGTTGSNFISGTKGTDIIVPNGATGQRRDGLAPRDVIHGFGGNDVVVLGGSQADWKPRLPGAIDYPSTIDQNFWKDSPKGAYGRSVVLENTQDKSVVVLVDVDKVVFADKKLSFEAQAQPGVLQPELKPEHAAELETAIKSGQVRAVPTKILSALAEAGTTPEQLDSAKAQSTLDAQKAVEKIPLVQQMQKDMYEVGNQIGADILKRGAPAPASAPASAPAPAAS